MILKNTRHELFALAIVKGMSQKDAAIEAGYKVSRARFTGRDLATYRHIIERIRELQERVACSGVMSVIERKERLSEIGRADLINFVVDGEPELTKDTPNKGAAAEFYKKHSYTKQGDPVITKAIKLHNPITAIGELNKMEHIYEERVPAGTTIVNTFMFILPGGKRVRPQELREVNPIEADEVIE